MDPSVNAWASATKQSSCRPVGQMHDAVTQKLPLKPTSVNPYKSVIDKLTKKLESIKENLKANGGPLQSTVVKGKDLAVKAKSSLPPAKNTGSSKSVSKKKLPAPTTPKRGDWAASAPPAFQQKTPKVHKPVSESPVAKPSPKRHPQKLQTGNFPPALLPTKVRHWNISHSNSWNLPCTYFFLISYVDRPICTNQVTLGPIEARLGSQAARVRHSWKILQEIQKNGKKSKMLSATPLQPITLPSMKLNASRELRVAALNIRDPSSISEAISSATLKDSCVSGSQTSKKTRLHGTTWPIKLLLWRLSPNSLRLKPTLTSTSILNWIKIWLFSSRPTTISCTIFN